MKKNLVTKKHEELYKYRFLPFLEVLFTVKNWKNQDLVVNQQSLGSYFEIDRKIVADFLKQAEKDNLIEFVRKVRKFDDKTVKNAMRLYKLVPANEPEKYYSRLQEYINTYMYWMLDFGERLDFFYDYIKAVENSDTKSIKQLEKEEKAKAYCDKYPWTKDIMKRINELRPERLKSKYLCDGKLRENNYLCATLNPEKDHEAKLFVNDLMYRYILLEEFFGTKDFIECDTNASIYRLSYNLNHDKLLDDNIDIYEQFWKIAGFKGNLDKVTREGLKLLCMIIFMSNGAKNGYNSTLVLKDDNELSRSELHRKDLLNYMSKRTGLNVRKFLDTLTNAMYKFLDVDAFLEEEIFIYESNLHLLILDECYKQHIQVINVYDGFYFKKADMTNKKYNIMYKNATKLLKQMI